jgi:diguanylate cyclase (GGDEF)-like protein
VNTGLRWTAVPQLAVFAFAAALGLAATRFLLHRHSLAAGAAWALVASFIALDGISAGGSSSIHFAAAGLLLVVGATAEPHYVARRDEVTRLPTRLEFNRTLRELPRRYALAWVEIDEFQRFRQDHGRDAARLMLRQVARTLAKVRGGGEAFSYDGHIFTVVFPRTSAKAAAHHLDAVRRIVEAADLNLSLPAPERPGQAQKTRPGLIQRTVSVTITVGVAEPTAPDADPREVLRAAEQAMQNARHAGMNRVGLARDEAPALG